MVETKTRRRLQWLMLLVAVGLVAGTTWKLVADPATGSVAAIGQLLAAAGALTTLLVTVLLVRSDGPADADGPSPESAVGVLGSMTGMLAVTSASSPGRLVLVPLVSAGTLGLLGGGLLFLVGWRDD